MIEALSYANQLNAPPLITAISKVSGLLFAILLFFVLCYTNRSVYRDRQSVICQQQKTSATFMFSPLGLFSRVYHANSRHKEKLTVRNHRAVRIEGLRAFYISIMRGELQLSHVWVPSRGDSFRGWMPVPSAVLAQSLRFHVGCQGLHSTMFLFLLAFDKSCHNVQTDKKRKSIGQGFSWYVQDYRRREVHLN